MADAPRDDNGIPAKLACLNTDTVQGTHLVPIAINTSSGGIKISDATSVGISFTMVPISPKDQNYTNCWLFKGTDGLTYPAVATSAGALLINSN